MTIKVYVLQEAKYNNGEKIWVDTAIDDDIEYETITSLVNYALYDAMKGNIDGEQSFRIVMREKIVETKDTVI